MHRDSRQRKAVQLRFEYDQRAEPDQTASMLAGMNDNEPDSFDAAPMFEKVPRAEIERIPVLLERLDNRLAKHARDNAINDNSADDEACGEA